MIPRQWRWNGLFRRGAGDQQEPWLQCVILLLCRTASARRENARMSPCSTNRFLKLFQVLRSLVLCLSVLVALHGSQSGEDLGELLLRGKTV